MYKATAFPGLTFPGCSPPILSASPRQLLKTFPNERVPSCKPFRNTPLKSVNQPYDASGPALAQSVRVGLNLGGSWTLQQLTLMLDSEHPPPQGDRMAKLLDATSARALTLSESQGHSPASVALMQQLAMFCGRHDISLDSLPAHSHLREALANVIDWHALRRCGSFTCVSEARDLMHLAGALGLTDEQLALTHLLSTVNTTLAKADVWSDAPLVQLAAAATHALGHRPWARPPCDALLDTWLTRAEQRSHARAANPAVDLLTAHAHVACATGDADRRLRTAEPRPDGAPQQWCHQSPPGMTPAGATATSRRLERDGVGLPPAVDPRQHPTQSLAVMSARHLSGTMDYLFRHGRVQEVDLYRLYILPSVLTVLLSHVDGTVVEGSVGGWLSGLEDEVGRRQSQGVVAPDWLNCIYGSFMSELAEHRHGRRSDLAALGLIHVGAGV